MEFKFVMDSDVDPSVALEVLMDMARNMVGELESYGAEVTSNEDDIEQSCCVSD